jgi:leader peptidase (prepilin peptidase)/N-methyltransferase
LNPALLNLSTGITPWEALLVFWVGACIGSFLNVCIYRLPRELSITHPPSHCVACKRPIRWYENIPLVGYLWLRGRCRTCKAPIGWVHLLVELLTALAAVLLFYFYGYSLLGLAYFVFICALIVVSFIDLEFQIIPDEISVGGLFVGIALSFLVPELHQTTNRWAAVGWSLIGLLAGGGVLYVTAVIGDFVFKKESMGGGDIKLLAMAGTVLGWKTVLLTFFLAPMIALLPGLFVLFFKRSNIVPYGPFLAIAMLIALWGGDAILQWTGLAESFELLWDYYGVS